MKVNKSNTCEQKQKKKGPYLTLRWFETKVRVLVEVMKLLKIYRFSITSGVFFMSEFILAFSVKKIFLAWNNSFLDAFDIIQ